MSSIARPSKVAGRLARRLVLLFVGGLAGCVARPATQLIIHVDTDMAQGTTLVGYTIRVAHDDDGSTISDVDYSLRPGAAPRNVLPAELGVLARDRSEARRLDVDVTAELADTTHDFTVRAVVGFRADHAERLDVFLARRCGDPGVSAACEAAGQTCGPDGACIDQARAPLPDYTADAGESHDDVARVAVDAMDVDLSARRDANDVEARTESDASGLADRATIDAVDVAVPNDALAYDAQVDAPGADSSSCVSTGTLCSAGDPCCSPAVCSTLNVDGRLHCCMSNGDHCSSSHDCCGANFCCNLGGATGVVCRATCP